MPPPPGKKKKSFAPKVASAGQLRERTLGALWGLAVGDALGAFTSGRRLVANHFPTLNDGPYVEMKGGGPRELRPGQVSWTTEMAGLLSQHLRAADGYDAHEAGRGYARWLADAVGPSEPVAQALGLILEGRSGEHSGRRVWLDNGQRIRDASALARTAPIGVYFARHREERIRASLLDTAVTHFAPVCQLAAATVNGLIAAALTTAQEALTRQEALKVIEAELSVAASTLGRTEPDWVRHTAEAAEALREDVRVAQEDDPMLHGPELHLFVSPPSLRVSFRLALWQLFHAPTFEAAVVDVVNRGGPADLNAAITGALLGAVYGDQAIPARWKEAVTEAPGPMGGVHWGVYHPRTLLTLEPRPG